MHDRARIHVQAGGGGDGCLSFRREAHVPKGGPDGGDGGRGGDVVLVCDDSLRDLESFRRRSHFKARRAGHGEGSLAPRCRRRHAGAGGPAGHRGPGGARRSPVRPGPRRPARAGGPRRAPAADGNKRFAGPTHQTPRFAERGLAGRRDVADAAAQAARRRGPDRAAQRRQVLAAVSAHAGAPEDRRLPVHDPLAGPRHAAGRHPSAGHRRHPGADRGRQRRRRPGPRVPRPRGAHAAARPRARSEPARRLRSCRESRAPSSASWSVTTPGSRPCRGSSRCRRPISSTRRRRVGAPRPGSGDSDPRYRCSSPPRSPTPASHELADELRPAGPRADRRRGAGAAVAGGPERR